MPGLDTNVLVRWLMADDEEQRQRVRTVFRAAVSQRSSLFVPSTVMLELEWVLRSRYRLDKASLLLALTALLETRELEFQAEDAVERALHAYRQGAADFADCLHAGLCAAAGRAPMLTFDEKAARLAEAELIEMRVKPRPSGRGRKARTPQVSLAAVSEASAVVRCIVG